MSAIEMISQKNSSWLRYHKRYGKTFEMFIEKCDNKIIMYDEHQAICEGISAHSLNVAIEKCKKNFVEGIRP